MIELGGRREESKLILIIVLKAITKMDDGIQAVISSIIQDAPSEPIALAALWTLHDILRDDKKCTQ